MPGTELGTGSAFRKHPSSPKDAYIYKYHVFASCSGFALQPELNDTGVKHLISCFKGNWQGLVELLQGFTTPKYLPFAVQRPYYLGLD